MISGIRIGNPAPINLPAVFLLRRADLLQFEIVKDKTVLRPGGGVLTVRIERNRKFGHDVPRKRGKLPDYLVPLMIHEIHKMLTLAVIRIRNLYTSVVHKMQPEMNTVPAAAFRLYIEAQPAEGRPVLRRHMKHKICSAVYPELKRFF